ncbi:MAG: prepilin-type N-terminal cleavage/methylation domain-containing protein [Sedimentisphaerales bacterium]|nr:prepilin-type N-terminal cleavage/methylation domain-containing protein [Sedimentisphaerales bacterium]
MERKGFTLVELLVVIAIIALLMGILMPALSRVRQIAFRLICGTNLSGIGKAMMVYANDYDDEFPRAGSSTSTWGNGVVKWDAANRQTAYGLKADGTGGAVTVTSSLYLLIKYAEVTPKSFICKGDSSVKEFEPGNNLDVSQLWDFGTKGTDHCSYSYHMPYSTFALTTSSDPGMAVAADPNPWIETNRDWNAFNPTGSREAKRIGNAITHQEDGQNVLFIDSHVEFEDFSFCGVNEDNIYTGQAANTDLRKGVKPSMNSKPLTRSDSLLIDDRLGAKGRPCFLGDTDVWVDGRLIKISEAAEGQTVGKPGYAVNALCSKKIEKVEEHEGSFECRDIYLENGNQISVVAAHRFMLENGLWVSAQHLSSGMKLMTLNGAVRITKAVKREMPFEGKVYNLKVKDSEQYLVGADGIVVRDW